MIRAQFRIDCDTAECAAVWPAGGWAADRRQAWQDARAAGWSRDYEQHRCPDCSPRAALAGRVRELAASGMPDRVIGARLGMTCTQVRSVRVAYRIPGRRPGRPRNVGGWQ